MLRLPLTDAVTVADAHEIIPAGDLAIEDLVTRDTVWLVGIDGGPQRARAFGPSGRPPSGSGTTQTSRESFTRS